MGAVWYSNGSQTLELSAEPCWKMKLSDEEYGRMKGLGDWNQDGIIDWVGLVTCRMHEQSSVVYKWRSFRCTLSLITVTSMHGGDTYVSKYWTTGSQRITCVR